MEMTRMESHISLVSFREVTIHSVSLYRFLVAMKNTHFRWQ